MLENRQQLKANPWFSFMGTAQKEHTAIVRRRGLTEIAMQKRDKAFKRGQTSRVEYFQAKVDEYSGLNEFMRKYPNGLKGKKHV